MISPPAKFSNQTNNISANNSSAHSLYTSRHTTLSLLDSILLCSTLLELSGIVHSAIIIVLWLFTDSVAVKRLLVWH